MHEFIILVGFEEEAGLSCYCIVVEDMLLEVVGKLQAEVEGKQAEEDMLLEVEGKQAEEDMLVVESRLVEEVGIGHLPVPGNPATKKINNAQMLTSTLNSQSSYKFNVI